MFIQFAIETCLHQSIVSDPLVTLNATPSAYCDIRHHYSTVVLLAPRSNGQQSKDQTMEDARTLSLRLEVVLTDLRSKSSNLPTFSKTIYSSVIYLTLWEISSSSPSFKTFAFQLKEAFGETFEKEVSWRGSGG
jgi:hypothetical protein